MICSHCNTPNSDTAKFCVNCGHRLQIPQAQAPPPTGSGRRSATAAVPATPTQTPTTPQSPQTPPNSTGRRTSPQPRKTPPQIPGKKYAQGKEAVLAVVLSIVIPGIGQLYNGDTKKGLIMLGVFLFTAWTGIGWLIMIIWSAIDANNVASGKSPLWQ